MSREPMEIREGLKDEEINEGRYCSYCDKDYAFEYEKCPECGRETSFGTL